MAEYQFVLLQNDFILQRKPHSPQREFKMKFFFFFFPFLSQIHTEARFMNQVSSLANTRKTAENAFIHPLNPVQVCHLSLHQCDQMINKKIPKFLLKLPEYLCLKSHLFKIAQKSTNLGYFWKKCCHQELKKIPQSDPTASHRFFIASENKFLLLASLIRESGRMRKCGLCKSFCSRNELTNTKRRFVTNY